MSCHFGAGVTIGRVTRINANDVDFRAVADEGDGIMKCPTGLPAVIPTHHHLAELDADISGKRNGKNRATRTHGDEDGKIGGKTGSRAIRRGLCHHDKIYVACVPCEAFHGIAVVGMPIVDNTLFERRCLKGLAT